MVENEKGKAFGEFVQKRRAELGLSMRKFAERISINVQYLSNIEYGVQPAPLHEMLDKIIKGLQLTAEGEREAYDLAAIARGDKVIAQDATYYISDNPIVVRACRTAKDNGVGVAEWERFIAECEKKQ